MINRTTFLSALMVFSIFASLSAQALEIYNVSNTSAVNCSGAPHGLWTNNDIGGGSCSNFFSIDATFTLYNDDADSNNWYAELLGTATNPQSVVANIDLTFSTWSDAIAPGQTYKKEGGAAYDPATMDFFSDVEGSISIGADNYLFGNMVPTYTFQYGQGANAKDPNEFGGSAWIQALNMNGQPGPGALMASHHWDLNLTFTPVTVPGPASIVVFSLGLLGFGVFRKKAKAS